MDSSTRDTTHSSVSSYGSGSGNLAPKDGPSTSLDGAAQGESMTAAIPRYVPPQRRSRFRDRGTDEVGDAMAEDQMSSQEQPLLAPSIASSPAPTPTPQQKKNKRDKARKQRQKRKKKQQQQQQQRQRESQQAQSAALPSPSMSPLRSICIPPWIPVWAVMLVLDCIIWDYACNASGLWSCRGAVAACRYFDGLDGVQMGS